MIWLLKFVRCKFLSLVIHDRQLRHTGNAGGNSAVEPVDLLILFNHISSCVKVFNCRIAATPTANHRSRLSSLMSTYLKSFSQCTLEILNYLKIQFFFNETLS